MGEPAMTLNLAILETTRCMATMVPTSFQAEMVMTKSPQAREWTPYLAVREPTS